MRLIEMILIFVVLGLIGTFFFAGPISQMGFGLKIVLASALVGVIAYWVYNRTTRIEELEARLDELQQKVNKLEKSEN